MTETVKIDPVARLEGHYAVKVEVDNGIVVGAKASGTLLRGIQFVESVSQNIKLLQHVHLMRRSELTLQETEFSLEILSKEQQPYFLMSHIFLF